MFNIASKCLRHLHINWRRICPATRQSIEKLYIAPLFRVFPSHHCNSSAKFCGHPFLCQAMISSKPCREPTLRLHYHRYILYFKYYICPKNIENSLNIIYYKTKNVLFLISQFLEPIVQLPYLLFSPFPEALFPLF